MNFENIPTPTLIVTWENLRKGLDKVNTTIENGSFHTVGPKGAAPPSQSGQLTLVFALAVYKELESRGVPFVEKKPKKRGKRG